MSKLDQPIKFNNMGNRGSIKSIVKWTPDNKSLNFANTSTFERNGESTTTNTTEVWALTDGGKSLTITTTRQGREGTPLTTKRVYDKK